MDRRNYLPPNALRLGGEPPEFDDRRIIRRVAAPQAAGVHPAAELMMMEDRRIASQQRDIETIYHENERLAVSCVGLRRELAAAKQELRDLSSTASAAKAEADARVSEVYEKSLIMDVDIRAADKLRTQWAQVTADVEKLTARRTELAAQMKEIGDEMLRILPEVKQFHAIKAEIDTMHTEVQRGRAAVENERKIYATHLQQSRVMEKHIASMDAEIERLHMELDHAKKRERAAAAAAGLPVQW